MLDKETWRKDYWFLSFTCSLVWFLYTAKCEFSSKLRFYIKDWSLSRGSGATVGLIFPEIFVSPLSEFEQHMYSSDPRTDTGSLMQLESNGAVPQASHNSTTRRLRSEKTTADFGITHISFIFLFFDGKPGSCKPICGIIIANKSFSSAKVALVYCFRASRKNRRHLGCSNVMRSGGCAVQNKGITLSSSTRNWNVGLDKRKFSYHSWTENSSITCWSHAPVLGSCHIVLSMEHWLIMMATKSFDHSDFFLLRFLLKRFIISAEFSPKKGVTLLIKGNGRSCLLYTSPSPRDA